MLVGNQSFLSWNFEGPGAYRVLGLLSSRPSIGGLDYWFGGCGWFSIFPLSEAGGSNPQTTSQEPAKKGPLRYKQVGA